MTGIVFAPLLDSPETAGDALARLPALTGVAYETAGNHAVSVLPRLHVVATGFDVVMGSVVAELPALSVRAASKPNSVVAVLPRLRTDARDAGELVPQSGDVVAALPALAGAATAFYHVFGDVVAVLPPLGARVLEPAGNNAIAALPALGAQAADAGSLPTTYAALVQPTGYLASYASTEYAVRLDEVLALGAAGTSLHTLLLRVRLLLEADPATHFEGVAQLTDRLTLDAQLAVIFRELLTVSMALGATHTVTKIAIAEMVDALLLGGSVSTAREAYALITEALAFGSLLDANRIASFSAGLSLSDQVAVAYQAAARLLDTLLLDAAQTPHVTFAALMTDELALSVAGLSAREAFALLQDKLEFVVQLSVDDEQYVAWTMNAGSRASSRYTNWPFNSHMKIGDRYYGVAEDGRYLLEGDDDDGTDIYAMLRFGMSSIGQRGLFRIPEIYYGTKADGDLRFKLVVADEDTGERVAHVYRAYIKGGASLREGRVEPGRGLRAGYFDFVLENVEGSDFEIDHIDFKPLNLDRRVRGKAGGKP